VASRDEAAFAELVRRHGGTVWDVCRSVLGNRADADDAFQAVFLTLARRAARLRKPGSVGAWLHGVAVRVARKARAAAARRAAREADAPPPAAVEPADPSWAEVRAVVHDALAALPAVYRDPLVACYLRGLTQDDAASELGLSKAAVKKRLERGRDRLRAALTSRGLGPAVVLAVGTAPASAVPDHLLHTAPWLAAGSVPVPDAVLRLVEGGVSMTFAKLTASVVLVVGVGFAVAAQDGRPRPATGQPPRPPAGSKTTAPKAVLKEAPATPKNELAGVWTVTWVETNGEAIYDAKTRDETLPAPTFVFTGDRCEVKGIQVLYVRDFRVKLDPTKTPKEIDAIFLDGRKNGETVIGETVVGIYTVRGNELRICLRLQRPDLGRPKGYVTNSGTTLYTFILTRGASPGGEGTAAPTAAGGDGFDAILRAGNKLYFVLDRPKGEGFRDEVAAFGRRLEVAVRTTDRVRDKDLTVVFFKRDDPTGNTGTFTGMSRDQLRRVAEAEPEKRGDKLLEHAWVLGRLPKDAEPVPPAPPPARTTPAAPAPGPAGGAKGEQPLTTAELAALVTGTNGNPTRAYGKRVEFTAKVETVGKGVDGGTVPFVMIEGWPAKTLPYGEVFVHNVFPDRVGKAGDRVRVRGRVVSHGYGTLTVWAERWTREEAAPPVPVREPAPQEVSIYDRVHRKADLPGPGTEVRGPKDR
jgi:RNA polymerase sigma factor (sigma-70 family)